MPKHPTACRFFLKGTCTAGDKCQNTHDRRHAPCKYHWLAVHGCRDKNKCAYWHGQEDVETRFAAWPKWETETGYGGAPGRTAALPRFMIRDLVAYSAAHESWCKQWMAPARLGPWLQFCRDETARVQSFKQRKTAGRVAKRVREHQKVVPKPAPAAAGAGWGSVLKGVVAQSS